MISEFLPHLKETWNELHRTKNCFWPQLVDTSRSVLCCHYWTLPEDSCFGGIKDPWDIVPEETNDLSICETDLISAVHEIEIRLCFSTGAPWRQARIYLFEGSHKVDERKGTEGKWVRWCVYMFQKFRSLTNVGRSSIASTPWESESKCFWWRCFPIRHSPEDNTRFQWCADLSGTNSNLDRLSSNFWVHFSWNSEERNERKGTVSVLCSLPFHWESTSCQSKWWVQQRRSAGPLWGSTTGESRTRPCSIWKEKSLDAQNIT